MKQPTVEIPKLADVAKDAAAQTDEATEALAVLERLALVSEADLRQAVAVVAEMKDKRNEVDAQLKTLTKPLKGVIKDIEKLFKPAIQALDQCEAYLKMRIADYAATQAEERDRLLGEAGRMVKESAPAARALIAQAETHMLDKVPGLALREAWDGEVVDVDAIPREYLIPDVKALKALTRARKGDPRIPGWRAYPVASVAITVAEVER